MIPIVVQAFTTLDGVIQSPGAVDEDAADGFRHGGWQFAFPEADDGPLIQQWESRVEGLLLGRVTHDIWAQAWGVWPLDAPGPIGDLTRRYNAVPRYVASSNVTEFAWAGTRRLGPDVAAHAAELRRGSPTHPDGELRIWGSTQLVRALAAADLIDEYRLITYPLVLGEGKRLFGAGFPSGRLELVSSEGIGGGAALSVYRPGRG